MNNEAFRPTGGGLLAGSGPDAGTLLLQALGGLAHRGAPSFVGSDGGVRTEARGRLVAASWGSAGVAAGRCAVGGVGVAIAGGFVARDRHRAAWLADGALFRSSSDAELLLHRLARSRQRTLVNRVVDALVDLDGGYALAVVGEDRLVVARDPRGIRPLFAGERLDGSWACSERAPLVELGVRDVREVPPGTMLVLDGRNPRAVTPFAPRDNAPCCIEVAVLHGPAEEGVWAAREALGRDLAERAPCPAADLVLGFDDGGVASGFAASGGMPYATLWLGPPDAAQVPPPAVRGRRVALVLTWMPAATAARRLVTALQASGAQEVHLRAALPPTVGPCRFGIDLPPSGPPEGRDAGEVARWIGATSVGFGTVPHQGCAGCLGGRWPVADEAADQLPLFTAPAP